MSLHLLMEAQLHRIERSVGQPWFVSQAELVFESRIAITHYIYAPANGFGKVVVAAGLMPSICSTFILGEHAHKMILL